MGANCLNCKRLHAFAPKDPEETKFWQCPNCDHWNNTE